jgi:N-acetylmuramic acid 6-phosphate etherase
LAKRPAITEQRNQASAGLDEMPVESILYLMNQEDRRVPEAVAEALPQIAEAVGLMVEAWRSGGRWIYIGAGTSGRIAALDAAECQPTFGVPQGRVVALIAGEDAALTRSVEGAEDDRAAAVKDLEDSSLEPGDAVVGLAASGRTPYVVAAVRHASELGCSRIAPDASFGKPQGLQMTKPGNCSALPAAPSWWPW